MKFFSLATATVAAVTLSLGAASAQSFRLSSETNENSSRTQGGERFGELLSEASGGEMTVKVFPNAVLTGGDQVKQAEMLGRGALDFTVTSAITISTVVPEMAAFSLPYLFNGYEDVDAAVTGPAGDRMKEIMEQHGMKLLGWGESGFREVTNSSHPIKSPADLKGLKIRVAGAISAEAMEALGATPVQIPMTQVYNGLQTGLIDGVISGASVMSDFKLNEVVGSVTTGPNLGRLTFYTVMNKSVYDGLPDDAKAAIDGIRGEPISKLTEEAWVATANAALDAARASGRTTVLDLDEEQSRAFDEALAAVTDAYVAEVGGEAALAAIRGE